jgi:bifunctional DNase/RNase
MLVEVRIVSLLIDPHSGLPIVVLMETQGDRAIPIVIGMAEAEAIALALQKAKIPRPRTHDLLKNLLCRLGGKLERVVVNNLRESTFYALLQIRQRDTLIELDARPSDAMALACRTGSKIFVENHVLEAARMRDSEEQEAVADDESSDDLGIPPAISPDATTEEIQEFLEGLEADDFGKYKM